MQSLANFLRTPLCPRQAEVKAEGSEGREPGCGRAPAGAWTEARRRAGGQESGGQQQNERAPDDGISVSYSSLFCAVFTRRD